MANQQSTGSSEGRQAAQDASQRGAQAAAIVCLILGLAVGLAMVGVGIYQLTAAGQREVLNVVLVAGGVAVIGATAAVFVLLQMMAQLIRAHQQADWQRRRFSLILDDLRADLRTVAGNSQLSDVAKSIAHRHAERETLRRALHEEIDRMDWEAAYSLADELERRFGYKDEAQRLREEIKQARELTIAARVEQALESIRGLLNEHQWGRARREVGRLQRIFPDDERVKNLVNEFGEHLRRYKEQLIADWRAAASRNEIDRSIELLKRLDEFLTPQEAAEIRDEARQVFKSKLLQLGTQLEMAVHDRQWPRAVEVANQIIDEFPNSQMALECRERMALLRLRAGMPPATTA